MTNAPCAPRLRAGQLVDLCDRRTRLCEPRTNALAAAGPLSASSSQREIRSGRTAGAGIEVGFAPNWSAKLEYLYADFGNVRTTWLAPAVPLLPPLPALNDDARLTMNVVRAGVNYRF